MQKMAENDRFLTVKQEQAILELLNPANGSLEEIAKKLGLTPRTLYRWQELPHFQDRLREERKRLRESALSKLQDLFNAAIEELSKLLKSTDEKIQLRACQIILDYNMKIVDIKELEERLERLEMGDSLEGIGNEEKLKTAS